MRYPTLLKYILAVGTLSSALLVGCGQNNTAASSAGTSSEAASSADTSTGSTSDSDTSSDKNSSDNEVSTDASSESVVSSSELNDSARELTISIVNLTGADIGMISFIDPISNEQVNLDSLPDQEAISVSAIWPKDTSDLQWAIYNMDGELVAESTTDISSAQTAVTLILEGDGDFENVSEQFD